MFIQPVFKRFLRPEKDYLSFSLIYNNGERSLDLVSFSFSIIIIDIKTCNADLLVDH